MTDLDELERLLREATPGPWTAYNYGDDIWYCETQDGEDTSAGKRKDAALIAALRNCGEELIRDARRYRSVRRGQHWSVINGIGDTLRAETLDAAIDNAIAQEGK